jgi:Rod binding domain-containing protein
MDFAPALVRNAATAKVVATDTPDQAVQRARIHKVAKDFEQSFLSVMLGEMFKDVSAGDFGGGPAEGAFKSLMTDAFAKQMTDRGGIGLSPALTRQMLHLQGLEG